MIICDDNDLFGGRISVVSAPEFCCQIETAGERMRLAPATVIRDLLPSNSAVRAGFVASLVHDSTSGPGVLLARHRALVEFLDRLGRPDQRLSLASAVERAHREFSHFGEWKWPVDAGFDAVIFHGTGHQVAEPRQHIHELAARMAMPAMSFQGHADSPLAD